MELHHELVIHFLHLSVLLVVLLANGGRLLLELANDAELAKRFVEGVALGERLVELVEFHVLSLRLDVKNLSLRGGHERTV